LELAWIVFSHWLEFEFCLAKNEIASPFMFVFAPVFVFILQSAGQLAIVSPKVVSHNPLPQWF